MDNFYTPIIEELDFGLEESREYKIKPIMSETEKEYYEIFKKLGKEYIVEPQINLCSVIEKNSINKKDIYRNELFRNVDFGIFDKDHNLLLLIEVNDKSHKLEYATMRDRKVRDLCRKAGIKLMIFTTYYRYQEKEKEILSRIKSAIKKK